MNDWPGNFETARKVFNFQETRAVNLWDEPSLFIHPSIHQSRQAPFPKNNWEQNHFQYHIFPLYRRTYVWPFYFVVVADNDGCQQNGRETVGLKFNQILFLFPFFPDRLLHSIKAAGFTCSYRTVPYCVWSVKRTSFVWFFRSGSFKRDHYYSYLLVQKEGRWLWKSKENENSIWSLVDISWKDCRFKTRCSLFFAVLWYIIIARSSFPWS